MEIFTRCVKTSNILQTMTSVSQEERKKLQEAWINDLGVFTHFDVCQYKNREGAEISNKRAFNAWIAGNNYEAKEARYNFSDNEKSGF